MISEQEYPHTEYEKARHALLDGFGCSAPEGEYCGGCHGNLRVFEEVVTAQLIERFRQALMATGFVHDGNWPTILKIVRETP